MTDPKPQLMPDRIQRKRTKGWKMPENTVYVGRPTKWGNRYTIAEMGSHEEAVCKFEEMLIEGFEDSYPMDEEIIRELRGKNLACFCSLKSPCHADILLRIANED